MISFEFGTGLININLTYGKGDAEKPLSPLSLETVRRGTNFQVEQIFPVGKITPGLNSITLQDLDRALWTEPGQYDYYLTHDDGGNVTVITAGLLEVIKPITELPSYGIERRRKENYRA